MAVRSVVYLAFLIILVSGEDGPGGGDSNTKIVEISGRKYRLEGSTCGMKISMTDSTDCSTTPAPVTDETLGGDSPVLFKSADNPAKSCSTYKKYSEAQSPIAPEKESGYVHLEDPFEVECNFKQKKMCLITDVSKLVGVEINKSSAAFWFSNMNLNVPSFYKVNWNQLKWFQAQAKTTVTQTIRFYCKNMKLVSSDEEKNIRLMSWNGNPIDYKSTQNNPLHYETTLDNCKDSEDKPEEEFTTDIKVTANPNDNLPITDVYIRNIHNDSSSHTQSVKIELKEFCVDFE